MKKKKRNIYDIQQNPDKEFALMIAALEDAAYYYKHRNDYGCKERGRLAEEFFFSPGVFGKFLIRGGFDPVDGVNIEWVRKMLLGEKRWPDMKLTDIPKLSDIETLTAVRKACVVSNG